MRYGGLWIFWQLLGLVAGVVAVAGDQEARQEGTQDKGHQNTSNQKSVVDTVIGLVQLWRPPHTFKIKKEKEKGSLVQAFQILPRGKKAHFQDLI